MPPRLLLLLPPLLALAAAVHPRVALRARTLHHATRSPAPQLAAYDTFAALENELRAYLSALPESALSDAAAPSPLAYTELKRNGRTDLAEGCLKHGGYVRVRQERL